MLINFTVGNYRSFKENKTLSMEAAAITELKERLIIKGKHKLLPSAVIYGANSSGKSNLIKAMGRFTRLVNESSKLNSNDTLGIIPFLLCEESENQPSYFEIELFIENDIYRYGFAVDNTRVCDEWLFEKKDGKGKEKCLFIRTKEGIGVEKYFTEGKGLEDKTRDNALFLSIVDSFNGIIAKKIVREISEIWIISGIFHDLLFEFTNTACDNINNFKEEILDLIKKFDLGFDDFVVPKDKELARQIKAYTLHNKYDSQGNIIGNKQFNMLEHESSGTNKLFDLIAIIFVALKDGYTLVIDELDAKLHSILTRKIIDLFNDKETNPNNAQLIFATHDTNLLNTKTFRRDQIWFTEKDNSEASDLYSLVEFKELDGRKIRKDSSLEKDYINGRYGAIPYIKN